MRAAIVKAAPDPNAGLIARAFALFIRSQIDGREAMEKAQEEGLSPAVALILKSATAALTTSDTGSDVLMRGAVGAWADSLRQRSAFAAMYSSGAFQRLPFRIKSVVVTGGATGAVVAEGRPVPISRLDLADGRVLSPENAAATLVISDELAKAANSEANGLIERELNRAVGATLDEALVARITSTGTPAITASADPDDAHRDISEALSVLEPDEASAFYAIGAPDVIRGAATLWAPGAGRVFPSANLTGGSIAGIPLFPCGALDPGELLLIDASRIAGNLGGLRFETARHASVQMRNDPTNEAITPTETTMVGLWQNNLAAARVQVTFGAKVLRNDATVWLRSVPWGDVGSPA